jgi:5-methylcytosine-specific restriction endonuclease McrA
MVIMAREFARAFYSSKTWQDCRDAYAKSVHYLCEDCLKRGIYKPGVIVHHVEELTPMNIENPEISLGFNNLRFVCRECHAREHDHRTKGRRYLIGENGEIILK